MVCCEDLLHAIPHLKVDLRAYADELQICPLQKDDEANDSKVEAKPVVKKGLPSMAELEASILSVVSDLIGPDVAPDAPLSSQGLDSLAAMELRQKLQVGQSYLHRTCQ